MSTNLFWNENTQTGFPNSKRAAEDRLQRGEDVDLGVERAHLHTPHNIQELQQEPGLQELMDPRKGGGCRFQNEVKRRLTSHHSLRSYLGHSEAWDLEDLVKVGKKVKACPYYATRELKNSAQLIICPYNYLIEPKIRQSMEIYLKGQVLVLDEAHNIEDCARDAASGSFELEDIKNAKDDCEKMETHGVY